MAQQDLDLQLERVRVRLKALHKDTPVDPEPNATNRRPNKFITLLFSVIFLLFPDSNTLDELGPLMIAVSAELRLINTYTDYFEKIEDRVKFSDENLMKFPIEKLTALSKPSAPEMRYASSQTVFVKPPNKINLEAHMEYPPVLDKLVYQLSDIQTVNIARSESIAVGVIGQIDDLQEAIVAVVDKSEQKLHLFQNHHKKYSWDVSTARAGKVTPTGTWNAKWLSKHHKSSIYNYAPMPYSIFYNDNFAIHGTDQISRLGTPASSGCIRLHPENAAVLFAMVEQVGNSNFAVRVIE